MKNTKKIALLCCMLLVVTTLAGCFPFNILENILQNNQIGGADGPTSVIVADDDDTEEESEEISEEESEEESEEKSEEESEEESEESSDSYFDDFNFDDLVDDDEDDDDGDELDLDEMPVAWFDSNDEEAMWLFFSDYAILYEDGYNYSYADYEMYYNEDAIDYIANDLSEYGLTEEEQRDALEELSGEEDYFCVAFTNIEVFTDNEYEGFADEDIIPYLGYTYVEDDIAYYDILNMNTGDILSFYTYLEEDTTSAVSDDVQRIGSVENGYVDVPADYIVLEDTTDMIQYMDPSMTNIVTLAHYDKDEFDAESIADYLVEQFFNDEDISEETITGAMVELDGCEAYQIYGYIPDDDMFLVIWILDSPYDDEYIHYVAVEFVSDQFDLFEMVEDTYHVTY